MFAHLSLSGNHVQVRSIVGSREYGMGIILEGGCWVELRWLSMSGLLLSYGNNVRVGHGSGCVGRN